MEGQCLRELEMEPDAVLLFLLRDFQFGIPAQERLLLRQVFCCVFSFLCSYTMYIVVFSTLASWTSYVHTRTPIPTWFERPTDQPSCATSEATLFYCAIQNYFFKGYCLYSLLQVVFSNLNSIIYHLFPPGNTALKNRFSGLQLVKPG